jgi:hypothetical protein
MSIFIVNGSDVKVINDLTSVDFIYLLAQQLKAVPGVRNTNTYTAI